MNTKDLEYFKKKLLSEKVQLEEEMDGIGQKNPNNPGTWEATTQTMEVDSADENEVADKLEEYEENTGILNKLESQLKEVNAALSRIEAGNYGICEECGKLISKDRLEANPSSRVAIKHPH